MGAMCNMQTNQLFLTLIDPHVHYNPIPVKNPHTSSRRIDDPGLIAACHCGAEYRTKYSASIETHTATSVDSAHRKSIDMAKVESVDSTHHQRVTNESYEIAGGVDNHFKYYIGHHTRPLRTQLRSTDDPSFENAPLTVIELGDSTRRRNNLFRTHVLPISKISKNNKHYNRTTTKRPNGFGSRSTAEQVTQHCFLPYSHLTAIITGGTSGIGAETTRVLAKRGVRVVMAVRDMKKAEIVKERIVRESPEADIVLLEIDLSSLSSVARFCSQFLSQDLPLNIIINNAGIFSPNLEFSEEKIELTFATNFLGHYLLTEMLIKKMIDTAKKSGIEGRVINLTSVIHSWVKPDCFSFPELLHPIKYNGTKAYAQSKLATILHAKALSRRLKDRNANVTINAVHPGIVKTGIIRAHKGLLTDSLFLIASKLLKSVSQGAATTCYVALSNETKRISGKYFADSNETNCSDLANDVSLALKLCTNSHTLIHDYLHLSLFNLSLL
uniref:3-oxoacyl-[acyl-carrier-protein] reductase n=1 Tax=Brassica campestris TaxID=3711 RepID=M4FA25_BRACM